MDFRRRHSHSFYFDVLGAERREGVARVAREVVAGYGGIEDGRGHGTLSRSTPSTAAHTVPPKAALKPGRAEPRRAAPQSAY